MAGQPRKRPTVTLQSKTVQYTYAKPKTKSFEIANDFVYKRPLSSFQYAPISMLSAMDQTSQSIIYHLHIRKKRKTKRKSDGDIGSGAKT